MWDQCGVAPSLPCCHLAKLLPAPASLQSGILKKYNVELIGAKLESINKAEDRDLFAKVGSGGPCCNRHAAPAWLRPRFSTTVREPVAELSLLLPPRHHPTGHGKAQPEDVSELHCHHSG